LPRLHLAEFPPASSPRARSLQARIARARQQRSCYGSGPSGKSAAMSTRLPRRRAEGRPTSTATGCPFAEAPAVCQPVTALPLLGAGRSRRLPSSPRRIEGSVSHAAEKASRGRRRRTPEAPPFGARDRRLRRARRDPPVRRVSPVRATQAECGASRCRHQVPPASSCRVG
jgi:hypothetical protein